MSDVREACKVNSLTITEHWVSVLCWKCWLGENWMGDRWTILSPYNPLLTCETSKSGTLLRTYFSFLCFNSSSNPPLWVGQDRHDRCNISAFFLLQVISCDDKYDRPVARARMWGEGERCWESGDGWRSHLTQLQQAKRKQLLITTTPTLKLPIFQIFIIWLNALYWQWIPLIILELHVLVDLNKNSMISLVNSFLIVWLLSVLSSWKDFPFNSGLWGV